MTVLVSGDHGCAAIEAINEMAKKLRESGGLDSNKFKVLVTTKELERQARMLGVTADELLADGLYIVRDSIPVQGDEFIILAIDEYQEPKMKARKEQPFWTKKWRGRK